MSQHQLLVELGCEELPPTALSGLSAAFSEFVSAGLSAHKVTFDRVESFATPRRLAVRISGLPQSTPVEALTIWGPPAAVAFKDGVPTKAAEAFAAKNGLAVDDLKTANDGKVDKLFFETQAGGEAVADLIPAVVTDALGKLPINKRMRWGASREEFVRPVHWLVMLLDDTIIPGTVLGLEAGRDSRGHRFHANKPISIAHAAEYEGSLQNAHVVASFAERQAMIRAQAEQAGKTAGGRAVIDDDLLEEVTALVEWPVALTGNFDERFLEVPAEALISSMKEHQKYFHVVDEAGKLMPAFITVSNIESQDPAQVVAGNEKVIRPRLADAAFFFEQDQKTPLAEQREKLKTVVFQAKLGTVYEKTERIAALASYIAGHTGGDTALAQRAGELSKADLVTSMVYEFADMQGIAGYYYARHDGEEDEVARSLTEQYLPRFAGDALPQTATGTALALADRLDTLAGIFGLGQVPTGSKDPFALRRASVSVLRLLIENNLPLDLKTLLQQAAAGFSSLPKGDEGVELALNYMLERLRAWYEEAGVDIAVYQAVAAKSLSQPLDIHHRIHAVAAFCKLPEAEALAAANKRVGNILAKQAEQPSGAVDSALLKEPAEQALAEQLAHIEQKVQPLFEANDYEAALATLAGMRAPVDGFFDDVMVMAEDEALRDNRLNLLARLRSLFVQVADISLLAGVK